MTKGTAEIKASFRTRFLQNRWLEFKLGKWFAWEKKLELNGLR